MPGGMKKKFSIFIGFSILICWTIFAKKNVKLQELVYTIPSKELTSVLINSDSVHKHKLFELPDPKRGRGWRWLVAGYISAVYSEINFGREIYVFGVAGGNSIGQIRMAMKEYGLPIPRLWGFDSFSGIPNEAIGISRPIGWVQGAYDSSIANRSLCVRTSSGGESCSNSARLSFKEQVAILDSKLGASRSEINYIQGYYNESLSTQLYNALPFKPALFIDIDCDLYISTFQALDWMFKHNLLGIGTLIGYDDWCLTNLGRAGESRAHNEISLKYKVKFRCILGGCTDKMMEPGRKSNYYTMVSSKVLNPIFVVESIGYQAQSGMEVYPKKCKSQSEHWTQT